MLRCSRCGKPVLLLNDDQKAKVEADPERYAFVCTSCVRAA
jgi:DNA-directed RNA polymerase subunit RPC12/RpoP